MNFDTTHEYNFNDPSIYYCTDHEGLIIADYNSNSGNNRLAIENIEPKHMLELAKDVFTGYKPAFLAVKDVEKRDKTVKEIYDALGKYLADKSEKDLNESLNKE